MRATLGTVGGTSVETRYAILAGTRQIGTGCVSSVCVAGESAGATQRGSEVFENFAAALHRRLRGRGVPSLQHPRFQGSAKSRWERYTSQ